MFLFYNLNFKHILCYSCCYWLCFPLVVKPLSVILASSFLGDWITCCVSFSTFCFIIKKLFGGKKNNFFFFLTLLPGHHNLTCLTLIGSVSVAGLHPAGVDSPNRSTSIKACGMTRLHAWLKALDGGHASLTARTRPFSRLIPFCCPCAYSTHCTYTDLKNKKVLHAHFSCISTCVQKWLLRPLHHTFNHTEFPVTHLTSLEVTRPPPNVSIKQLNPSSF